MAKKTVKFDPGDDLIVSEVGPWASEKHARVQRYIEIASATRKKYVPPPAWHAGAAYIELFSGPGRSLIRGTKRIVDGSPLVAFNAAQATVPFTEMHLNDVDPGNSSAVDARIRALGGAATCYSDPADIAVDKIVAAVNPSGLHFAFLDPYNLEGLSFDIIRRLSKLKVDMLIHVSVQDLQRNLDDYSKQGGAIFHHDCASPPSLCQQIAAYNPDRSWKLLAEAEYWEHLANAALLDHFQDSTASLTDQTQPPPNAMARDAGRLPVA
jgi:three-Cys-motif partner protein